MQYVNHTASDRRAQRVPTLGRDIRAKIGNQMRSYFEMQPAAPMPDNMTRALSLLLAMDEGCGGAPCGRTV